MQHARDTPESMPRERAVGLDKAIPTFLATVVNVLPEVSVHQPGGGRLADVFGEDSFSSKENLSVARDGGYGPSDGAAPTVPLDEGDELARGAVDAKSATHCVRYRAIEYSTNQASRVLR